MTNDRIQKLKEHYFSQKGKSEKILMYEFYNHIKHEIRVNSRERRRGDIETKFVSI